MVYEKRIILFLLIIFSAISWLILFRQIIFTSGVMSMHTSAPFFITMWTIMMVAMMFPAAAPMILTFSKIHSKRQKEGKSFVPAWIFISAYLLLWIVFGIAAYLASSGIQILARQFTFISDHAVLMGGLLLIIAGLYQLSPLKNICLTKCRSPFQFIITSWKSGYLGSFRMGLEHGMYCLGCCWLLFLILFPLGIMNITLMMLLTILIFAEKTLPFGMFIKNISSVVFIFYGLLIIIKPGLLPVNM